MKESFSFITGAFCTILLCIPTLTEQNDVECCDGEVIEGSVLIGMSSGHLDNLKSALPDLHLTVTSPGWETTDGLEQLRTIAKPTLGALGTKLDDIEEFLVRIDAYESNVPFESKTDVRMTFGRVGKSLLIHFTQVEMMREVADTLYDAYSLLYSESHPDALSSYRDCLDKSIERIGTKTRLVFGDWVNLIEKKGVNLIEKKGVKDSDILSWNIEAQVDISTNLVNIVHGIVPSDRRVCYAEHLERTNED
ncbi:MAG: hypothetical protein F4039_05610 [Gammaproteobacteria bacterium]|nr:hypothetical protein [Gammaproteobacteria bacterium]MYF53552.1 hypothetical protein [Gammaproteobacteria bacterium]MYK43544.1 hypothetical protein [Gammaproteobacteria bacterium]